MKLTSKQTILGFDPGRDKCGVAVVDRNNRVVYHQIIDSKQAIAIIKKRSREYTVDLVVMGNGTTSKDWQKSLESALTTVPVVAVDEKNSTLEARDRYWLMYPPKGLQRMIPQGVRVPPRPLDDIVAILLIERYLKQCS